MELRIRRRASATEGAKTNACDVMALLCPTNPGSFHPVPRGEQAASSLFEGGTPVAVTDLSGHTNKERIIGRGIASIGIEINAP